MAEIPVKKKSSLTWLWIVLALIVVALLIWWLMGNDDDEVDLASTVEVEETMEPETEPVAEPPVVETSPIETPAAETPAVEAGTLAAILANPDAYYGETFTGEVEVAGPLTDRGFWVEHEGNRMFALIIDEPSEAPVDINPGMDLRITGGQIRNTSSLSDVEGDALDADTRQVVNDQAVILVVDESNIEILSRP